MILASFFDVSNPKSVISEKPILFLLSTPKLVKNFTYLGVKMSEKVSFLEIADFWFETSKNHTNII